MTDPRLLWIHLLSLARGQRGVDYGVGPPRPTPPDGYEYVTEMVSSSRRDGATLKVMTRLRKIGEP